MNETSQGNYVFTSRDYFEPLLYHTSHSALYFISRSQKILLHFSEVVYMEVFRSYNGLEISLLDSISINSLKSHSSEIDGCLSFLVTTDEKATFVLAKSLYLSPLEEQFSFNPSPTELFRHKGWIQLA